MGRPKKPGLTAVYVKIPEEMLRRIDAMAAREMRDRSSMLRVLISEALGTREQPKRQIGRTTKGAR